MQGAHGRVFNFSAGPATLPVPVLEQTQADLINFQGSGMSVMEMSHRCAIMVLLVMKCTSRLIALSRVASVINGPISSQA